MKVRRRPGWDSVIAPPALRATSPSIGRSSLSDYRYVPLVVQAPGRIAHQTQRSITTAGGPGRPRLDRRAQCLRRLAWKLGVRPADGVQDVGVRAAELRGAKAHVQAARQLVEDVKARRSILDLDRVELELRRQPSDPVDSGASRAPLRSPEGMHGNSQAPLVMDRVHSGGRGHPRPNPFLDEQRDDVPVAARPLFADDHLKPRPSRGVLRGAQRAFDGVVVCNRDHIKFRTTCVIDQLLRRRPPVARRRMHMEVRPTSGNHGCASYARRAYHRPTETDLWGIRWWRWRPWKA